MDQRTDNSELAEVIDGAEPAVAVARAVQPVATQPKPRRRWLRTLLLVAGPLVVIIGGAWWYYAGGRYVSTDNAYVQADMVNISPQISGPISQVAVHENQQVKVGDVLFRIERRPFEIAVEQAKANLAMTAQDLNSLKETYKQQQDSLALAKINLEYAQRKFDRQSTLEKTNVVSQQTLDDTRNALDAARQQVVLDGRAMQTTLARLGGSADTPVEAIPQYLQAKAALDKAQLDLLHTIVESPFNGVVSNMPQPGQYVTPGGAVMSLVSAQNLWIDANFKEIQLTYVKPGQEVDIWVDTYPDQVWHGTVLSMAPATGSEFSVIPAQNATGNWVKVVQRITVRVAVDPSQDGETLRAGMSTEVEIDTHHQRALPGIVKTALSWFGDSNAEARTVEAAK
jgi:membrane fusion protein, multidrug efflux system